MAAPIRIDWERIEPGWRQGVKSVPQLAAEYTEATGETVTAPGIRKHFKELGIPRDLSAKVQAKAKAIVSASTVSGIVSPFTSETDAKIINQAALEVAQVQLTHRTDIRRYRELAASMLRELEVETGNPELFEQIGELLRSPDDKGDDKLNEAYRKAISLPQRIDGVKKLADTLKTIIGLEREAFGMSEATTGQDTPAYVWMQF